MKKYLFIALAALGFAACAEKIDDNSPVQKGELEESYIAINLMAADVDTRAVTDDPYGDADKYGYEYGTNLERSVKRAHFFFFLNGEPFVVNQKESAASAPGDVNAYNHLELKINTTNQNDNPIGNISDISNAVLILSTYKGQYPNQIVAVLNWAPDDKIYTLEDLRNTLFDNSLGNDNQGYVMTNSVYMDSDASKQVIDVTPITADNIKTSEDDAKKAPVDIYVERTAAKVVVTANNQVFQVTEDNALKPVGGDARTVYVQLKGWELYNEFDKTNLLKSINTELTAQGLGLTWNDSPYFRSYWASTKNQRTENDKFSWSYTKDSDPATTYNGFPTEFGYAVASSANYANRNTYTYCAENTLPWTVSDVRTKVILKGTLVEQDGDSYKTLELARWYGNEYAGKDDLKTAVANSLKYTLFYFDTQSNKYVSIAPEDIEIVHGSEVNARAYEVGFQLTSDSESKVWYKYSSATGYAALGTDGITNTAATNTELAKVKPAVLYTGGDTYYIVDIKHLGKDGSLSQYGIVRNHVYQIAINSIKGYGSPGYSGLSYIIENPEYPIEDEGSYVAARINVLSWKVVQQGVDIETK